MTARTVLVLPSEDPERARARSQLLKAHPSALEIRYAPGPAGALAARVCASINEAEPVGRLHVVAFGGAALMLPSIALAQRAAGRRVAEYVMVEPDIPQVTDSWPDAPVILYVGDKDAPASRQARLRGWAVLQLRDLGDWEPAN